MWLLFERPVVTFIDKSGRIPHRLSNSIHYQSIFPIKEIQMSTPQEQFKEAVDANSPKALELAKTIDLNTVIENGLTPLMYTCNLSRVELVEMLLARPNINVDAV